MNVIKTLLDVIKVFLLLYLCASISFPSQCGTKMGLVYQSYVQLFHHFAGVLAQGRPLKKEDVKLLTL